MKLGTVIQQPTERLSYTIDYSEVLTDGDNVSSSFAIVSPAGLTVEDVTPLDPRVRFWVTGGTAGTTYKVTVTTSTADGRVFQDEVIFKIKEI
jgi:hypothetical protein